MPWFGGRKRAREEWRQRATDAGLRVAGIERSGGNTYQMLAGDDAEQAKAFLRDTVIDKERFYILVQTPDGNWGVDLDGLYLENLRPWQLDTSIADCKGRVSAVLNGGTNMEGAANGWTDNYVARIQCGKCDHEWFDGIRYRDRTAVRCPQCRARNVVDSHGFTFTRIT